MTTRPHVHNNADIRKKTTLVPHLVEVHGLDPATASSVSFAQLRQHHSYDHIQLHTALLTLTEKDEEVLAQAAARALNLMDLGPERKALQIALKKMLARVELRRAGGFLP